MESKFKQETIHVEAKPFGIRDKIGYASGDLGNSFTFTIVMSFLMIFYTNVYGLSGATVGILFLLARLIDAFADVYVGRLVDNSRLTAQGRFRPWISRMKYPLLVSLVLLFVPIVRSWPMGARIAYVFITYIAYGILYSMVNIPYGSMASAISNNPNDKTSLSTFRSIGSAIGGALIGYVIPMVVYVGATERISGTRFFMVIIGAAIAAWIFYEITVKLTTERIQTKKQAKVPLKFLIVGLAKNKALVVLAIVDILMIVNTSIMGTYTTYVFNDYFRDHVALSLAMIMHYVVVLVLAPFSKTMTERWGRKECTTVSLFVGAISYGVLFFAHTHSAVFYLVVLFIASLGLGVFNLMVWAFITDVIDEHEVITGVREDGVIYGVNSFARKFAQAIGSGLSGFLLTIIGYQSSTHGGVLQTGVVVNKIYGLATGVPALILLAAAVILLIFYPLNKQRVLKNAETLTIKHKQND